jgi:hypothetical protein
LNPEVPIMVARELTVTDLDDGLLLDLVQRRDPLGLLSIYIDARSETRAVGLRSVAIEVKNRLTELERGIASNGSSELADALHGTVRRIAPVIDRLVDPRSTGRGHALFAALGATDVICFSSQLALPNRVVLDPSPFVHPLLELLEVARPAGVVLASDEGAEILDWRLGELRGVARVIADESDQRRDRSDPLVANGARAQQITPMREQQAHRERERRLRQVGPIAAEICRLSEAKAWERILISGGERLTTPLVTALPDRLRRMTIRDPRHLVELDPSRVEAEVAERLGREQAERNLDLGRHVRNIALGAGKGAVGLSEVVAALNDARAEHVIYDPELRYAGAIGDDGYLFAWTEAAGPVVAEPRLTERIVERALDTGARLTPIAGVGAGVLRDADGIAALLRW